MGNEIINTTESLFQSSTPTLFKTVAIGAIATLGVLGYLQYREIKKEIEKEKAERPNGTWPYVGELVVPSFGEFFGGLAKYLFNKDAVETVREKAQEVKPCWRGPRS